MKDFKSIMIGFLLATSMFLFMGQTSSNDMEMYVTTTDNGKYQLSANGNLIYIVNTQTGETWHNTRPSKDGTYWTKYVDADGFRD